jgi:hypothetical protein
MLTIFCSSLVPFLTWSHCIVCPPPHLVAAAVAICVHLGGDDRVRRLKVRARPVSYVVVVPSRRLQNTVSPLGITDSYI